VTITQRLVTVKANDAGKMSGSPDPTFTWDLDDKASSVVVGEEAGVNAALSNVVSLVRTPEGETSGSDYVITTNVPFASAYDGILQNYRLAFVPAKFAIRDKVALTIFVADKTVTYGDAVPADLGFKVGAERYACAEPVDESKIAGLETVTFATTYKQNDPVGDGYSINTNSADLTSLYYDITVAPGTLTVEKKTVTVSPDANQYRCLDEEEQEITWTATGVVNDDPKLSGAFARESGDGVGTYTINLVENFDYGANYHVVVKNYGKSAPAQYKYTISECGKGVEQCPWGYRVRVLVRTTANVSVSDSKALSCKACYREPAMRRYIGYFFGKTAAGVDICGKGSCGCADFSDPASFKGYVAMWNFDTKEQATPAVDIELLNRIGYEDTSTAELAFTASYLDDETAAATELRFAGFGLVSQRDDGTPALRSASGFCAGTVPGFCTSCDDSICGSEPVCTWSPAVVWRICAESATQPYAMNTVYTAAYGKWSMQWDAEIVNRIAKGRTIIGETAESTSGFTPSGYEEGVAKDITADDLPYQDFEIDE